MIASTASRSLKIASRADACPGRLRLVQHGDRRGAALSEATVKTHVGHIMAKLGLRDRIQAVVYAYETGLIAPQGRR
jgi:hypothetical protein